MESFCSVPIYASKFFDALAFFELWDLFAWRNFLLVHLTQAGPLFLTDFSTAQRVCEAMQRMNMYELDRSRTKQISDLVAEIC